MSPPLDEPSGKRCRGGAAELRRVLLLGKTEVAFEMVVRVGEARCGCEDLVAVKRGEMMDCEKRC